MFTAAHFPVPSADTNSFLGLFFREGALSVPIIEGIITNQEADIELEYNGGIDPKILRPLSYETTNGLIRFTVSRDDTNSIYAALIYFLREDKILATWQRTPAWVGTNEYEFFVKDRLFIPQQ